MVVCPHCKAENFDKAESCFRCGQPLSLTEGSIVGGRYQIQSLVGKGGMGAVYRAHDKILEETVALKILLSTVARSPEMGRRFRSEIKLARKVSHRNVCRIHEYGEEGPLRYICMEYIEGINLKQAIRAKGPLPVEDAYDAAGQIARGLEAIHEAGIIHRDLKTANIMRTEQGLIKLMDFGIAKRGGEDATTGVTAAGEIMGTPEYMSPEQARGQKIDFRSDIYALGIVIFEMLTGAPPFRGPTPLDTFFMHVQDPPPLEKVLPAFVPILRKALAKNPDERFATARGVVVALRQANPAGAERGTGSITGSVGESLSRPAEVTPTPAAAAAEGTTGPLAARARDARSQPAAPSPAAPASGPPSPSPMAAAPAPAPAVPRFDAVEAMDVTLSEKILLFIRSLKDDDVGVRWRSALALWEVGPSAKSAIPALIEAVEDPSPPVAEAAAQALKKITGRPLEDLVASGPMAMAAFPSGPVTAGTAVTSFIAALEGNDPGARWRAAMALGEIGSRAREAVPALVEVLDDEDESVRWAAATALAKLGPAARDAVPALTAALSDKKDEVLRRHAAVALGKVGPAAHNAVAALIGAFKDFDATMRDDAGNALVSIGPAAVPGLIEALKDDDERVRWKAAESLTRIGMGRGSS
ncbi:MAG TPA: HEAT repeat domain-containing protein [Vicinamibacteria bacterium]|jgi:serine/threonine-protein kinase